MCPGQKLGAIFTSFTACGHYSAYGHLFAITPHARCHTQAFPRADNVHAAVRPVSVPWSGERQNAELLRSHIDARSHLLRQAHVESFKSKSRWNRRSTEHTASCFFARLVFVHLFTLML